MKTLNEVTEGSKHGDKSFNRILGIEIPDLLMNFTSCHVF